MFLCFLHKQEEGIAPHLYLWLFVLGYDINSYVIYLGQCNYRLAADVYPCLRVFMSQTRACI